PLQALTVPQPVVRVRQRLEPLQVAPRRPAPLPEVPLLQVAPQPGAQAQGLARQEPALLREQEESALPVQVLPPPELELPRPVPPALRQVGQAARQALPAAVPLLPGALRHRLGGRAPLLPRRGDAAVPLRS